MVMRPSVYKPDILENAESAIRAGGRGTLSMSTEMSTEKEPKEDKENDDDAKDEPQSEPLNPEERLKMLFIVLITVTFEEHPEA